MALMRATFSPLSVQLSAVLQSEPYVSYMEKRAGRLRDVVEAELYRLQYPSLASRVPRTAPLAHVKRAALAINPASLDAQSLAACADAQYLHCSIGKSCGFGCQAHHLVFCMVMAYGSNRTLVVGTAGWTYARNGWEGTTGTPCVHLLGSCMCMCVYVYVYVYVRERDS
jgi:hypothetical protein